jgi:hypothetical protein
MHTRLLSLSILSKSSSFGLSKEDDRDDDREDAGEMVDGEMIDGEMVDGEMVDDPK